MVNDNDVILYLGGDTDADSADEDALLSGNKAEPEVCVGSIRTPAETDS
jgi:hypothetical protein